MTAEEFSDLLAAGYESVSVEFKPGVQREANDLFHRVVRAVLAMANKRGGGHVVLGVEETTNGLALKGVPVAARASWKYDDVSAAINAYADPNVRFDRLDVKYKNRTFFVLRVHEFDDIPVLCRKGEPRPPGKKTQTLRAGACYVRSTRKPESIEVPSQTEMRELLDLAADKAIRRYLARRQAVEPQPAAAPPVETPEDRARFDQQRGDFR